MSKWITAIKNNDGDIFNLDNLSLFTTSEDDNYSCPICQRTIAEIGRKGQTRLQNWVLDHCHETETFRGWVCHHCNTGLGAFSDSLDRIRKAVIYLKKHEDKINEAST